MSRPEILPADGADDPDPLGFILTTEAGHILDCRVDDDAWADVLTPAFATRMEGLLGLALTYELGPAIDDATDDVTDGADDAANPVEIAILFTGDDAVAALNETHRGKTGATDVLSFPAEEDDFLGDIALAYGVMARQAQEMNISLMDHTLHLVLHGTLHLCGHDHIDDAEAAVMEGLEIDLLARQGIANPYPPTDPLTEPPTEAPTEAMTGPLTSVTDGGAS